MRVRNAENDRPYTIHCASGVQKPLTLESYSIVRASGSIL